MKQPSVAKAVKLINACVGESLTRGLHCTEITNTSIDFEIEASRFNDPLNYVLTRLWRTLGRQTRTQYSQIGDLRACYTWQFAPPAGQLQLRFTDTHKVVIRLVNEQVERRAQ